MAYIAAKVKLFVRHLCFVYLALPDPMAGRWSIAKYTHRIQGTRFTRRVRDWTHKHVA